MPQSGPTPEEVAFSAFASEHLYWTSSWNNAGNRALARDYVFADGDVLSRFAAEVIFRKRRAHVNGSFSMENLRIHVAFSNPDDDESGGTVIALAQSCDSLFAEMIASKGS